MTINIRNCSRCKRIFVPVSGEKICPDCRAEELKLEDHVKGYVRDHPGITVNQLIEGSGAPSKLVWRMIMQGQFENSGLRDAKYPCGNCGKLITRGMRRQIESQRAEIRRGDEFKKTCRRRQSSIVRQNFFRFDVRRDEQFARSVKLGADVSVISSFARLSVLLPATRARLYN